MLFIADLAGDTLSATPPHRDARRTNQAITLSAGRCPTPRWATDPLDNPDYERFLADFHDVLGRCPQTTTAQPHKDTERTRELLRLSHSLGSPVDRFSIISLNVLNRVHVAFSPGELLRVDCIPQNREAIRAYPEVAYRACAEVRA